MVDFLFEQCPVDGDIRSGACQRTHGDESWSVLADTHTTERGNTCSILHIRITIIWTKKDNKTHSDKYNDHSHGNNVSANSRDMTMLLC